MAAAVEGVATRSVWVGRPGPQGAIWSPRYDPTITDAWWQTLAAGKPNPRVVIHGGYGKHNLGDDAILDVLLQQIRVQLPRAQISVVAHGPDFVRERYGLPAYHFSNAAALRQIRSADLYVIGGGGIVNRINSYSGFQRLRVLDPKGKFLFLAARLARASGARVIFHSVGITSFPDPFVRKLTLSAVKWADAICVRDEASARLLRAAGVTREIPVVYDPAVRLVPATVQRAEEILRAEGIDREKPLIFVNFRPVADPVVVNAHTAEIAADLVRRLIECYNFQVVFFPFGRHPHKSIENDLTLLDAIRPWLGDLNNFHVIEHEYTPSETKALLGLARACVLERLHAAILAVGMGVPVVNVAYDDKTAAFMEMVALSSAVVPLPVFSVEAVEQQLAPWLV
jgi:polysaccharide pyruvyl transferase WcaK-like protein